VRVALKTGAYQARSIIADAQRCLNLYGEANPEDAPVPFTFYPTPGKVLLSNPPAAGMGRGLFRASNGGLYAVVANTLYSIDYAWVWTVRGALTGGQTTPVGISDNGTTLVIVDGVKGYTLDLSGNVFKTITDGAFYGSDAVDFADTYFVFNKPNSGQFYISNSNSVAFNPLYFATKIGFSDQLVTVRFVHRELWLLGTDTSEVWINTGATDFPYGIMNGAFVQHGCSAKYSPAQAGDALFWLAKDLQGGALVLKGQGYAANRVSTHAIETAIGGYAVVSDAVGYTYQQQGHQFYVLSFPTADKTWVFDITSGQWHERSWLDGQGVEHRDRIMAAAFVGVTNVGLDWETGALYKMDLNNYTDNGAPVLRRRTFPHMISSANRVFYHQFIADMEVGTDAGSSTQGANVLVLGVSGPLDTGLGVSPVVAFLAIDNGSQLIAPSALYLRWSDTRGASWSNPIADDFGATGDFFKSIQFQRLGMARDRVFELFWSSPNRTALNGAFIETETAIS
jgi:hypothetical protein